MNPRLWILFLQKNQLEIEHIDYQEHVGHSDHLVLVFDFTLEGEMTPDEEPTPRPNVFKAKYPPMQILFHTWQDSIHQRDSQAKWDSIARLYSQASSLYIPLRRKGGDLGRNKWMTRKALQAIDLKTKKYKVWKRNKTEPNLAILRQATNATVAAIREAKYNFEKSIAEDVKKGDKASFYAYLRSTTNIKEEVSRVLNPDGSLTNTLKDTVNVINRTFQSVFVKEGDGAVPRLLPSIMKFPLLMLNLQFKMSTTL